MNEDRIVFQGNQFACSNSFVPNLTSSLIADAVLKAGVSKKHILDLGCGCGALGLSMLNEGPRSVTLSDISRGAIKDSLRNLDQLRQGGNKVPVDIIQSDGFKRISHSKRFDIIINDISGIAEALAKISPWFREAPCNSGDDGLKFFKTIVADAPKYLSQNGILVTPLLSLSNVSGAYEFLEANVTTHHVASKQAWFLPDDMTIKFKKEIETLVNSGNASVEHKFGKYIAWTQVLVIEKSAYR